MRQSTGQILVPFALVATGMALLFLVGCHKEEAASDQSSPAAFMKDKAFRRVLDERRQEREDLEARRMAVVEQMKAKVDAAKAALATDDEARVKAALEKDPEWQSLYARCVDLNTALEEQRKKTLGAVREKMSGGRKAASTKTISK